MFVRLGTVAVLAVAAGACEPRVRPWDGGDAAPDAPAVVLAPRPPSADASGGGSPSAAGAGGAAPEGPAAPDEPAPPARVGGPWVRCYGNFRASGQPVKDVTRLALLCGPENGMVRLSKEPLEGAVTEGGPPITTRFAAVRGECYRVFAVADAGVSDLDVVVRSSRGTAVAADHGEDAWPIVQPDRPLCALEDDKLDVEVTARRGSGRFAAEIWRLPAASPRGK